MDGFKSKGALRKHFDAIFYSVFIYFYLKQTCAQSSINYHKKNGFSVDFQSLSIKVYGSFTFDSNSCLDVLSQTLD